MIIPFDRRKSDGFLAALSLVCMLSLTTLTAGCSNKVSLSDLKGAWRGDAVLPGGIRVQSVTLVDKSGAYILYLTNTLAGQIRTATLEGTLSLSNGWLIETITNDVGGNTLVPRLGDISKIVDLNSQHLILAAANGSNQVVYLKDSNFTPVPPRDDKK